jgi:hypothetical protein
MQLKNFLFLIQSNLFIYLLTAVNPLLIVIYFFKNIYYLIYYLLKMLFDKDL